LRQTNRLKTEAYIKLAVRWFSCCGCVPV